jgi:outer membrane protein assembly factor BamB
LCLAVVVDLAPASAQWRIVRPNDGARDELELGVAPSAVLPKASRATLQQIARVRRALQEGQFRDAAVEAQKLLSPEAEDGFVPAPDGDPTFTTVRREARQWLAAMPPADQRSYESQFGLHARSLLDAAARSHDRAALWRIADEQFGTRAGHEAAMLLACDGLDRAQPLEAVAWLRRIGESAAAIEQCEPEFWLLLTTCWLAAGEPEHAREAFTRLKDRCPQAELRIGDKTYVTSRDAAGAWQALERSTCPIAPVSQNADWRMFRGNAARNGRAMFDGSLGALEWSVKLVEDEKQIQRLRRAAGDGPRVHSLHSLVVGDTVLVRTPTQLVAVDVASGRRRWEYPWDAPPGSSDSPDIFGGGLHAYDPTAERIWKDAAYGQISSDGRLVFLLDRLATTFRGPGFPLVQIRRGVFRVRDDPAYSTNELVALELSGKLAWSIGNRGGQDEPKLGGAFFLGPPLPEGPRLYVLAEIEGEIRLCVLRAATGRLEWWLPVAHPGSPITRDSVRRLAGATPSLAEGVLVCPTTAGAVVAVDPATRSLLWSYPYARAERSTTTWADASVAIAEGRALVAPPDSDLLFCLDLCSGREVWSCRREENQCIACVERGKVVLVSAKEVIALRLANRKPAWKSPITLPADGTASGRGLYAGRFYYLPTTAKHLLQIDLEDGRIVRQTESKQVLGNLIGLGNRLISQTAEEVELCTGGAPAP